jgi:hypothetical protein
VTCRTRRAAARAPLRLGTIIFLAVGCTDRDQITKPTAPPPTIALPPAPAPPPPPAPTPPAPIPPPPSFPLLSRPGRIYRADNHLYDDYVAVHLSSLASRYVLYDGGQFALQFASVNYPFFEYPGHYTVVDSVITFAFAGDPRWQATGTLKTDSLLVKYNVIASLSDFVDGAYAQQPALSFGVGPVFDCTPFSDPSNFLVTGGSSDAAVPVGAMVEWVYAGWLNSSCTAQIASISAPPGGEQFDSGVIHPNQSFHFLPRVAGTWRFTDKINGGEGSFMAKAP